MARVVQRGGLEYPLLYTESPIEQLFYIAFDMRLVADELAYRLGVTPTDIKTQIEPQYIIPKDDKLFSIEFQGHLSSWEMISEDLRQKFKENGIILSQNAIVSRRGHYLIKDNKQAYCITQEDDKLNIYNSYYSPQIKKRQPTSPK